MNTKTDTKFTAQDSESNSGVEDRSSDAELTTWPNHLSDRYRRQGLWRDLSLPDAMQHWCALNGAATALIAGEGRLTFDELNDRIDRLAAGLHGLGLVAGDTVLVQLPNRLTFIPVIFAVMRLGAHPVLVLPAHREREIVGISEVALPVAYIVSDKHLGFDYRPMAINVQNQIPSLQHVIIDETAGELCNLKSLEADPIELPPIDPFAIACLLLSGGTTGTPKLIPRTHADYLYNATASADLCGLKKTSVYLAALPAAHNFTLACPGILGTLSAGGTVVFAETPSPDECFNLISQHCVTHTALVPSLADAWLAHRSMDSSDLSSLSLLQVGGSLLATSSAKRIQPELCARLQQVFGMAEGLVCYTRLEDCEETIQTTQGRPLSDADEIRIVDPNGKPVRDGQTGELWVRGPYTIQGYFRASEHNLRSFSPEGFYKTGDLVSRDTRGNIRVEGRIKEQINRGGEKFSAVEIEGYLREHPSIQDAAVLGINDKALGERSRAVLLTQGSRISAVEVRDFLHKKRLARFKIPDEIAFVTAWPLTAVGKIDKRRLAEETETSAKNVQITFLEETIKISSIPRELSARLVSEAHDTSGQTAMLYERLDEWSVGLGSLARVTMTAQGIEVRKSDGTVSTVEGVGLSELDNTLHGLGFRQWRVYGISHFELARHIYNLPLDRRSDALLVLDVPRFECRLTKNRAVLRATTPDDLARLRSLVRIADKGPGIANRETTRIKPKFKTDGADVYQAAVSTAVKEIREGVYQKVILSRKVQFTEATDLSTSYMMGREFNQCVRSFLRFSDGQGAAGFSPETVVEVDKSGLISTQPLAGTRALGPDSMQNAHLAEELSKDTKEIAEHALAVKVADDELNSVCAAESVHVTEFMHVKPRGAVQHLASRVNGNLATGKTRWDAFAALFPAVTASGCPKKEAIEAIGRLESEPRGLYSGCVFIADEHGLLDAALVLRSFFQKDGQTWLQAGAGIVDQSRPSRELQETVEKMTGVASALVRSA